MSATTKLLNRAKRGIPPTANRTRIGANIGGGQSYYDLTPVWANLVYQANLARLDNGDLQAPRGPDGWPSSDFSLAIPATVVKALPDVIKLSFLGSCNAPNGNSTAGRTVSNFAYDAASNRTSVDLTAQAVGELTYGALYLTGTKRTPQSATNTGITDIRMMRQGYEHSDAIFTDEMVAYLKHFKVLRSMDWSQTNDDVGTVQWSQRADPATAHSFGRVPWEYIFTASLLAGADAWINIPLNADDNYITQLATLAKQMLGPTSLNVIVEISNEVWNFRLADGLQFKSCLKNVCAEINGFIGGFGDNYGIASAVVSNNTTLTLTLQRPHGLTTGQTIFFQDNGQFTTGTYNVVTVVSPTAVTMPCKSQANGAVPVTSSWRGSSVLNGDLSYDGNADPYSLGSRWLARRVCQASTLFRAVWGDSAIGTRVRPVFVWQVGGPSLGAYPDVIKYINHPSSLAGTGPASRLLYGIGHAPYAFLDASRWGGPNMTNSLSTNVADYITAQNLTVAHGMELPEYPTEAMVLLAKKNGLRFVSYEGGTDTSGGPGTGHPANQARTDAFFDPGLLGPLKKYLGMHASLGGAEFCWYTSGIQPRVDSHDITRFNMTDDVTHTLASNGGARVEAIDYVNGLGSIRYSRNAAPGVIDGRLCVGSFSTDRAPPTMRNDIISYSVVAAFAGNYSLRLNGGATDGSHGVVRASVNGADQGGVLTIPNTGDLATWTDSNAITIHLDAGLNALDIVATQTSYNSFDLACVNSLTISNL